MLRTRSPFQLLSAAKRTRSGFTLLEILVAVGAVALVSVGIAAIFDSVGKTVNTGRKMSRNQAIATRVEQQMRKDFSQISREGFLVIRQQSTSNVGTSSNNGFQFAGQTDVELSNRDVDKGMVKRDRRIDEILFFAKGKFTSAMEPLTAANTADAGYYVPTSNEAAIYYGHGQKREANAQTASVADIWSLPRLDDDISVLSPSRTYTERILLGAPGGAGIVNPNRYASDWILLRKPTLLIQPRTTSTTLHPLSDTTINMAQLRDSDVQISGQPAASSIFQRLSRIYPIYIGGFPTPNPGANYQQSRAFWSNPGWNDCFPFTGGGWVLPDASARRPLLCSGIVDIATTDLTEIRTLVTTCPARPPQISTAYDTSVTPLPPLPPGIGVNDSDLDFPDPSAPIHAPWQFPVGTGDWQIANDTDFAVTTTQGAAIYRMHSWMENAFPTRSDGFTQFSDQTIDPRAVGCRTRCESGWTSRDNVILVSSAAGGPPADPTEAYFKRRNQLALSAHNFLEHCSEFIVEWSFGLTDPRNGNIIWYGTPAQIGAEDNPKNAREMTVYRGDSQAFDPNSPPANFVPEEIPYNPFAGMPGLPAQLTANPALTAALDGHSPMAYRVSKHLIYGNYPPFIPGGSFPIAADTEGCFTSHFGYFDPSFNPRATPITLPSEPVSPSFESLGISSLPWAWPKMVRITVRVADETDPTLEESFQFVIDLPPTPRP